MPNLTFYLGTNTDLEALYAFPNNSTLGWSLPDTILHWFNQTLERDGYAGEIDANVWPVGAGGNNVPALNIQLSTSSANLLPVLYGYELTLTKFLAIGKQALDTVVPMLKSKGLWDPRNMGWRFFMPMGLPMLNQKSLQFFHYPPIKMLEGKQNYLDDPVPARIEELLIAAGVKDNDEAKLYETIIDGAPVGAPDDAGSAKGGNKTWGYIPIQYFTTYQIDMVKQLLTNTFVPNKSGFTIPIMVYGEHPRKIFSRNFLNSAALDINVPTIANILPGLKTPVMGANHPYLFYWNSQVDSANSVGSVGDGKMIPAHCAKSLQIMTDDIISAAWQKAMADDPTQNVQTALQQATSTWTSSAKQHELCSLTQHQATMLYTDAQKLSFTFRQSLKSTSALCSKSSDLTCTFIA